MNKILATTGMFALAALALPQATRADQFGPDNAAITITWQAQPSQSPRSASPVVKDYYTARLDAWAKAHPTVKLDISYNPTDIAAGMTRLQEQAAAGRAPDMASIDSFFITRFYQYLQPLDAFYPADEVKDFVPFAAAGMHGPDGKLKAIWLNTDVRALHYRTDLVTTPPKTWDEMIALASDLSKKGYTGYLFPGGRGEASVMEHLPMFWAQGGELLDATGRPVFGEGANRTAMINVLNFLKRAVDSGASPNRVVNYAFEADMYPEILRGNVAMYLGGSWMTKQLHDVGDKMTWAVAPMVQRVAGNPVTAAGGWTLGVFTPDPAKQALIADLMNSMVAGRESMAAVTAAQGNLPTRISVAQGNSAYVQDPLVKSFLAMLAYGRIRPGSPIYPVISTELQVAISSVITGQMTAEAALDQAWTKVMQQYGK
jgi:multiple sugar transport system substrate-binding protein